MESLDDEEANLLFDSVTDYYFEDGDDEPVSFSVLPIKWSEDKSPEHMETRVFLHGAADEGLQKVYIQVIAWKMDLSGAFPEVSVLSKDNNWIKLQKPKKSFNDTVRTILITIRCLHYVKLNPETSEKGLWDHLRRVFSLYETRPSENDLLDHVPLIRGMVERDEGLSKSKWSEDYSPQPVEKHAFLQDRADEGLDKEGCKDILGHCNNLEVFNCRANKCLDALFLPAFLERPKKRKASNEVLHCSLDPKRSKFIVDDDEDTDESTQDGNGEESDEETDLFDSVCAICDNGGDLLCCEGKCLRSFHATEDAGVESSCESLRLSTEKVETMQNFQCQNCEYKMHQCFACGKLGSSDKSNGAEVFPCVSATCGNFYHPECVAKLLHPGKDDVEVQQKKIAAGESFTCPVHKCLHCKQGENEEVWDLQFALCRRCPTAYHRKCLPHEISFEEKEEEGIEMRAWDELIPNRILIYCQKHVIDPDIGTPIRNHIKFPEVKKKVHPLASQMSKRRVLLKKEDAASKDSSRVKSVAKKIRNLVEGSSSIRYGDSPSGDRLLSCQGSGLQKKSSTSNSSKKISMLCTKPVLAKAEKSPLADESKTCVRVENMPSRSKEKGMPIVKNEKNVPPTVMGKSNIPLPVEEGEIEKKILALVKKSECSLSLKDIISKQKLPSTYSHFPRNIDKTITQGKVEHFVEAVRAALQKLEEGGNIEDAKAVCEPKILDKIMKWKNKLKVYLAPFLHGMRYTSFGRHFTKEEKLKEIVDKLHWYVQNRDTIVDFCCGANDFSLLMRDKLQESGKQCSFKNFDIIQPKNDFSFEERDWMTVYPEELPTGSQLIMGLNPPFGVKAALANKFIDKALEFKPKLLILIVPKEADRLDKKKLAYDLIWEDGEKLSGKSFYLPGSVDVYDKQMDQWNLKPPVIYLWSRSDWTERHQAIASKQGHISKEQEVRSVEANHKETPDEQEEDHDLYHNLSKIINDFPVLNDQEEQEHAREEITSFEKDMEISLSPLLPASHKDEGGADRRRHEDDDSDAHERNGLRMENSQHETDGYIENPKERENEQKHYRDMSLTRMVEGRPTAKIISPSERRNCRSTLDNRPFETFENLLGRGSSEEGPRHFDAGLPGSSPNFGISYGSRMTHNEDIHDIERRYSVNRDDPSASRSHRWTAGLGIGSGIQGMDNGLPGYVRDWDRDTFRHNTYASDVSMAEKYGWNGDLLQQRQIHTYGQQSSRLDDISLRNHPYTLDRGSAVRSQLGPLSSISGLGQVVSHPSPFRLSSLSSDSSWMGTSVTQRYAPHLDEMNYARSRSSFPPGAGSDSFFEQPGPRSGFHTDTRGFALGPQRPFPQQHQGSSGWLDE